MSRIALLLLVSAAGLGAARAAPADPVAEPLPVEVCGALHKDFAAALRFPLKAGIGAPTTVTDDAPAGTACTFSGQATGLGHSYGEALGRLEKVVEGWDQIPEISADGPESILQGYRKGDRRVVVALDRSPPDGTCENTVQSRCKVPAKRWRWTFKAAAYRQ